MALMTRLHAIRALRGPILSLSPHRDLHVVAEYIATEHAIDRWTSAVATPNVI
jgi:hypothetical protein